MRALRPRAALVLLTAAASFACNTGGRTDAGTNPDDAMIQPGDDASPREDVTPVDPDGGSTLDGGNPIDPDAGVPLDGQPVGDAGMMMADVIVDPPPPTDAMVQPGDGGNGLWLCTGGDIPLATLDHEATWPTVVWTGTEYGVIYQDNSNTNSSGTGRNWEIYLTRLTADGTLIASHRLTTRDGPDTHPHLAWANGRYYVSWFERAPMGATSATVRVAPVTVTGDQASVGTALTISTTGAVYSVERSFARAVLAAADNGTIGVAWTDGRLGGETTTEIYFRTLSAAGVLGPELRITNDTRPSRAPTMAWSPMTQEFGLVWEDDRHGMNNPEYPAEELYFARVGLNGQRPAGSSDLRLTDNPHRSFWPTVIWDGAGYAIIFANERAGFPDLPDIWFARVGPRGETRAPAAYQISGNMPGIGTWTSALVWDPNRREYVALWEDQRHEHGEIVLQRLNESGQRIGNEYALFNDLAWSAWVSATYGPGEIFTVWEDNRNGGRDIWGRRIASSQCR